MQLIAVSGWALRYLSRNDTFFYLANVLVLCGPTKCIGFSLEPQMSCFEYWYHHYTGFSKGTRHESSSREGVKVLGVRNVLFSCFVFRGAPAHRILEWGKTWLWAYSTFLSRSAAWFKHELKKVVIAQKTPENSTKKSENRSDVVKGAQKHNCTDL